jgi:hypothetical protein
MLIVHGAFDIIKFTWIVLSLCSFVFHRNPWTSSCFGCLLDWTLCVDCLICSFAQTFWLSFVLCYVHGQLIIVQWIHYRVWNSVKYCSLCIFILLFCSEFTLSISDYHLILTMVCLSFNSWTMHSVNGSH